MLYPMDGTLVAPLRPAREHLIMLTAVFLDEMKEEGHG